MTAPRPLALLLAAMTALPLSAADGTSPASAAASTVPPAPTAAEVRALGLPDTIAPDAKVTKLAGGFGFTEGATCAPNGDVYFVDQNNNKILRWDVTAASLSTFLTPSGRANGQYFDGQGNLIACADEKNELWSIAPDGTHTVLISDAGYQGKPLDGPNDVWVRPDGGLYITDPYYARKWWDPAVPRPSQTVRSVYYLDPGHKTLTRVGDYTMPNGIIGTPDGKTLFVSDINARHTWGYDIQPDGSLAHQRLIANFGSDGMTLDDKGNLYMAANLGGGRGAPGSTPPSPGVTVVSTQTGKAIGYIPVPETPANMCFAGKNHDTLYIAARTGFYMIPTRVKGANPAK